MSLAVPVFFPKSPKLHNVLMCSPYFLIAYPIQGHQGMSPMSAVIRREAGTPWTGRQSITGLTKTRSIICSQTNCRPIKNHQLTSCVYRWTLGGSQRMQKNSATPLRKAPATWWIQNNNVLAVRWQRTITTPSFIYCRWWGLHTVCNHM